MIPLVLVGAGVVALAVGVGVLRGLGTGYRVGRLLAATPIVSIAEALAAADGPPRYLGVRGRIDSEAQFEDDAHRPLVLRRARIQLLEGRTWRTVDEHREAVAFEVNEGLDTIAVDEAALDEGLVVVRRESVGTAADVPDRVPDGTPPGRPVRLRVDQVSAVEHAIVLGVPIHVDGGGPAAVRLTSGLGRPLILTTLERDEAMRVLAEGDRRGPLAAAIALGTGLVLLSVGLAWGLLVAWTGTAMAATPSPTAAAGDPRSSGQGPGLVGDPLVAIGIVLAIALVAIVATTAYVRLTADRPA